MNRKIIIFGLIGVFVLIGVALLLTLQEAESTDIPIESTLPSTETPSEPVKSVPEPTEIEDKVVESTEIIIGEGEMLNPLTGLPMVDSSIESRRPIAVMLDNLYPARPQAGLKDADICYEILAEGRITRYLVVFYSTLPDLVGPIRSARPYFIEKALELDAIYVHVGGSNQALKDIKRYEMADIDGLSSGAFWRENHKRIPHNMYSSANAILKEATNKRYRDQVFPEFNPFYSVHTELTGKEANEIKFVYKEPTQSDSIGYYTSYKYNNETRLYSRYTNGKPHVDEIDQTQLTCTNIVVQYAKTKVIDSEGRLQVDFVGTGSGRYYTDGHVIDITWEKQSPTSVTEFFDLNGSKLLLNPGKTWIQVYEEGHSEEILN